MTELTQASLRLGAGAAAEIPAALVPLNPAFRMDCARNACGYYGRCWACPPDAGPIEALMARLRGYETVLAFTTAHPLADPFDSRGMLAAARAHNGVVRAIRDMAEQSGKNCLALGAGACGLCEHCAKQKNAPCRFPKEALLSLEACGVDAAALAKSCGLSLSAGKNRVVFLGMVAYAKRR